VLAAAGPHDVDPDVVDVVHVGRRTRAVETTPLSTTTRWVYEMVYDRLLAAL
jgi:hypothetical protein